MNAMVIPPEHVARSSLEQHGPWLFRDRRYIEDGTVEIGDALLQLCPAAASLNTDFLRKMPRTWNTNSSRISLTAHKERVRRSPPTASADSTLAEYGLSSAPIGSTNGAPGSSSRALGFIPTFSFMKAASPVQQPFEFSFVPPAFTPWRCLKRRRAVSDVDGPNTASQACKKRRLRKDFVTSRLSHPFSMPATHIINREFVTGANRQFLKLAAIMSARRMSGAASISIHQTNQPSPSSLLRRAAVINRFRLNVKDRATERGHDDVADLANNAALLQQNHGVAFVVGARFPVTLSSVSLLAGSGITACRETQQSIPPFQLSLAAVEARPRPTSLRLKATDSPRVRLPPSPRTRPLRSPEPGCSRPLYPVDLDEEEELDDDEVAFPTSEYESRYDSGDNTEDVYADFGMIFGGGGADDEEEQEEEEQDHCEDYMDDMDGIPWTVR